MSQKYKVFIQDVAVYCTNVNLPSLGLKSYEDDSIGSFDALLKTIEHEGIVITCPNPIPELMKSFHDTRFIIAAGGFVRSDKGNYLVIKRLGKWDLPKGKVEQGENIVDAAIREVIEECGIPQPNMTGERVSTYHTYQMKGKNVLKRTDWFRMEVVGEPNLIPQMEEEIEEARWMSPDEIEMILKSNTYPAIIDVVDGFLRSS